MTLIRLTKKQVSEVVKIKNLRKLTDKQIEDKLLNEGYKIINIKKEGRVVAYYLEVLKEEETLYNFEYVRKTFNTKKPEKFIKQIIIISRIEEENQPMKQKDVAKETGLSRETVRTNYKKMLVKKVIFKDGYYFFAMDLKTKKPMLVNEYQFKDFWSRNRVYRCITRHAKREYKKGNMSLTDYDNMKLLAMEYLIDNCIMFKVQKYKVNKDNPIYRNLLPLIEQVKKEEQIS